MHRALIVTALLASLVPAQNGAPTFLPKPHLLRLCAEDVPKLLTLLPQTTVGKLLAEPEVAAAFASGLANYRALAADRDALFAHVQTTPMELDAWLLAMLPSTIGMNALRELELADMQRLEFSGLLPEDGESPGMPRMTLTMACKPRAEGRWTAIFDAHARRIAGSAIWQTDPEAKFAGFPAVAFHAANSDNEQDPDAGGWSVHLPGTFAIGTTTPDRCGTHGDAPNRPDAQILGELDSGAYVAMFQRLMGAAPPEFRALGLDGLKQLRWRLRFVGSQILDEFEVELGDEPSGVIGALLTGKAKLPPQALPAGALAQLRCTIDVGLLVTALEGVIGNELPEAITKVARKALTGGLALGVSAPAKGSLNPRIYLSLGIADEAAFDSLLAMLPKDIAQKQVTYEGTPCTVLTIEGMPSVFQPAFYRRDGLLHVAMSGLSLRAFVKAQSADVVAMDVGDAPVPEGLGELLPNVDVRWDERALYETYHQIWLPLLKLAPDLGKVMLPIDAMPSPEAVASFLGKGRGVLRRHDKTFTLQQLGGLGGVELAAIAMTWGPVLSGLFHADHMHEELQRQFAMHQLTAVWPAFEAFHKANQRWPKDLGELLIAQKLPADALYIPGSAMTDEVPMPAGMAPGRSSYRYFPQPLALTVNGVDVRVLLIALAPQRYNRPMLAELGMIPDCYGEQSTQPIDKFGK